MRKYFKTAEAAKMLAVDQGKIIDLIADGSLLAVNIARHPGGVRPRWRISEEALEAFLTARQSQQPAPPPRKQRVKSEPNYY